MHRVEVAVELQRRPRPARVEPDDDGRRGGVAAGAALDGEAVGGQDVGEPVEDGAGLAGAAGHGDEVDGRLEQCGGDRRRGRGTLAESVDAVFMRAILTFGMADGMGDLECDVQRRSGFFSGSKHHPEKNPERRCTSHSSLLS